jgi:hypothetical protein
MGLLFETELLEILKQGMIRIQRPRDTLPQWEQSQEVIVEGWRGRHGYFESFDQQ